MRMRSDKPEAKKLEGYKRGLSVAWGTDILLKCPQLADNISKFNMARLPGGGSQPALSQLLSAPMQKSVIRGYNTDEQ